jgi:cytochrome c oxidase cbb3-type subunit 3
MCSFLLGFAPLAMAQAAPAGDALTLFYVVVGFVFVTALLVLAVALYMLQVLNFLARREEETRMAAQGQPVQAAPGLWARFWQSINDFVPVEKESKIQLDHNYDGIRELDNHLPPWWKWLLYGTIAWSAVYLVVYHVTDTLPLPADEYANEVALAAEELRARRAASPVADIDENNVPFITDAALLADGKKSYLSTCASCHRPDGGGDIGPNLTDEYWKNGGTLNDIYKVIKHGVSGTNMIAWGNSMSPQAMANVASYVLTLQGTNPANPKKPEGERVAPQPMPAAADTVQTQAALR